jgi:hypothetical protein
MLGALPFPPDPLSHTHKLYSNTLLSSFPTSLCEQLKYNNRQYEYILASRNDESMCRAKKKASAL